MKIIYKIGDYIQMTPNLKNTPWYTDEVFKVIDIRLDSNGTQFMKLDRPYPYCDSSFNEVVSDYIILNKKMARVKKLKEIFNG